MNGSKRKLMLTSTLLFAVAACQGQPSEAPSASVSAGSAKAGAFCPSTPGKLVVVNGGGTTDQGVEAAYRVPYRADCGVDFSVVQTNEDTAGILSQVTAGKVVWDVIIGKDPGKVAAWAKNGWLAEVDQKLYEDVDRNSLTPDAIGKYSVGASFDTYVLAYDEAAFPNGGPQTWADFFDTKKFPGPRAIPNWGAPSSDYVPALLAAGVSRDALTPFDYDKAFAQLDKIKDGLVTYTSGATQVQQILGGSAVMCICTDARAMQANNAGAKLKFSWQDALRSPSVTVILKNSPNPAGAQLFVRSMMNAQRQGTFTSVTNFSTVMKDSMNYVSAGQQKFLMLYPDNYSKTFGLTADQIDWIGTHGDEVNEKLNAWLSSQ